MVDPVDAAPGDVAPDASGARSGSEALYGLRPALVRAVIDAADAGDRERVLRLVEPLHYSDVADLLERLDSGRRRRVVAFVGPQLDADALAELDETVRDEVMDYLSPKQIADVVSELDTDDAVAVIEDLDKETQEQVLAEVEPADRAEIEQNLAFPEDTAGRMMQRDPVSIPQNWTVGETIDYMRETPDLAEDFYDIFVVDAQKRLKGTLPLNVLLRTRRPVRVAQVMKSDLVSIPATMDREEVARLFRDRDLVSAPVVDSVGRLVGMITIDDVVDVIDEEAEEDMLRLAKVSVTGIHEPVFVIARSRVQWLVITLINTILASIVISQFQNTIQSFVALAVLMPIVAAMGGNAGMQVVTVTVRALATKELQPGTVSRVIMKEIMVAASNGVIFATIMGTISGLWFGDWRLSFVLAAAMMFNMMWSGIAGTMIPLTLSRIGVDPAIAAGPFLTTTTDVLGFFLFLGLATVFLL
ncbi:MAG: magnesium transporter [Rhodospirillaceae bacterium]|nr:magnesium transporter [Rhodospirillaceae bacterium]